MSDGDGTAALYGNTTSVRAWAELHMNSYLHAVAYNTPMRSSHVTGPRLP